MGSMWLYTVLRFALFFALWGILLLIGLGGILALGGALVLSVPLSLVLLAAPRRRFAATIEARVEAHRARAERLDAELDGEDGGSAH
jgi:hypothetical protein